MNSEIIHLDTVDDYNRLFGLETQHPLVSVVDLTQSSYVPTRIAVNYGIYALFLKNTRCGDIRYGRQIYDYSEGTITSFAPGQVVEVEMQDGVKPSAQGIVFHPDLIRGTTLGREMKLYTFFRTVPPRPCMCLKRSAESSWTACRKYEWNLSDRLTSSASAL